MWKIASICAVSAVVASLPLSTTAGAAPAISTKPAITDSSSAVEAVGWRIVCHGRWHHKRCHRVWVRRHHRWHR